MWTFLGENTSAHNSKEHLASSIDWATFPYVTRHWGCSQSWNVWTTRWKVLVPLLCNLNMCYLSFVLTGDGIQKCNLLYVCVNVNLFLFSLTGKEDALAHLTKYHSAFDEADGIGWIPLHKAAVQLNKNILEITLKGKLFIPLDASERHI